MGPRRVLTRIVLWWSAFTMLTSAARGFPSLVAIRFLFGAGEAGAFPNIARSFSKWFPIRERGRANGVMFLGSRVGGMLSAPVALLIVSRWGWRVSFVLFGMIGLAWAAAWFTWYRDRPEDHPAVNAEELAWIRQDRRDAESLPRIRTPWGALLRSRNLYAICAMYFAFGLGCIYFTWLPTNLTGQLSPGDWRPLT
jgi:MFS family permease